MSPLLAKRPVLCVRLILLATAATILISSFHGQTDWSRPVGAIAPVSTPKIHQGTVAVRGELLPQ